MKLFRNLLIPSLCVFLLAQPASASKRKSTASPTSAGDGAAEQTIPRERLLSLLTLFGIQPGDRVADVRAGIPELTEVVAVQVGPTGEVFAVDVDPARLRSLASREGFPADRLTPIRGSADRSGLPEGRVDLVLIADSWRSLKKRPTYLKNLAAALTAEGRVVVVDFHGGELPVGPKPAKKISRDEVVREFLEAGWRHETESTMMPYRYCLVFYPPPTVVSRPYLRP